MDLQGCAALVPEINERAMGLRELSDEGLIRTAGALRTRDLVVAEAFAVAAEASRRAGGERLVADRLAATVALHFGLPAQGDVVLAAVVNAMAGRVVHVISSTDQLACQDADRARPVGRVLGLDVGLVVSDMDKSAREVAYRTDITCGRAEELGYDYLRDSLAWDLDELVQRGLDCAFVANVENNLVEYVLSAQVDGSTQTFARITAYGFFRRYQKLAGVGEPSGHPMDFEYEDVWDAQCRDFLQRRHRILTDDDFVEFGQLAGSPAYERRCQQLVKETGLGPEIVPMLQRRILLSCCDALWRDQLAGMSRLRERSLSHHDPVAEFRRQAATLYRVMWDGITRQAVDTFFSIRPTPP